MQGFIPPMQEQILVGIAGPPRKWIALKGIKEVGAILIEGPCRLLEQRSQRLLKEGESIYFHDVEIKINESGEVEKLSLQIWGEKSDAKAQSGGPVAILDFVNRSLRWYTMSGGVETVHHLFSNAEEIVAAIGQTASSLMPDLRVVRR